MKEGWITVIGVFLILLGVIISIDAPDTRPPDPMTSPSGATRAGPVAKTAAAGGPAPAKTETAPGSPTPPEAHARAQSRDDAGASAGASAGGEGGNRGESVGASVTPFRGPLVAPAFDIVRIEKDGSAVITGRAAPGSRVTVMLDSRPVAAAVTDARGEWTLFAGPFEPGPHDLRIKAAGPDGVELVSDDLVSLGLSQKADDEPLVIINHRPARREAGGTGGTAAPSEGRSR